METKNEKTFDKQMIESNLHDSGNKPRSEKPLLPRASSCIICCRDSQVCSQVIDQVVLIDKTKYTMKEPFFFSIKQNNDFYTK
jgi:hypothetical protein